MADESRGRVRTTLLSSDSRSTGDQRLILSVPSAGQVIQMHELTGFQSNDADEGMSQEEATGRIAMDSDCRNEETKRF